MTNDTWNIRVVVQRSEGGRNHEKQEFALTVDPDEYVLDLVERIWAFHDRSLVFRHACHHSTCGACGMLVNGQEKLTCITPVRSVTKPGGVIHLAPLRNFPVVADLAVDMGSFYRFMDDSGHPPVHNLLASLPPGQPTRMESPEDADTLERLADCIECGMCISACPASHTSAAYFGPAPLAGAHLAAAAEGSREALAWVDCSSGVWRCHSAFECTAVCPADVDPAWRIMDLRRRVIAERVRRFFSGT